MGNFAVVVIDVKSAFLYGRIKEEVYVCKPLRFEDPNYPDKVYKVVKALYGLHQAPRANQQGDEFHQIVDFLNASQIRYALTANPTIYVSLIKQFWQTATAKTLDNGEIEITATIDGTVKTVTEASVRRHLQLADADGISSLPTTEIFEQLSLMGSKKTAWEQFSSNIATAIICLATNRTFNFSKLIFDGMGPVVQGEGSTHPVESHHTPTSAPSTSQPPISPTTRRTIRQESMVSQPRSPTQTPVADEIVHKERGKRSTIPNEPFPQEIGLGGSPRRQETTLGDMPAQTWFERTMNNTRSRMTPAAIEEMINRRVTEALETCEANRNIRLGNGNDEGGNENGNGNGNGGGNGNGNHNDNDRDVRPVV
ncbi:putative ribonuclease H-like domain-containing protein [Tanacetum coccineum]